MATTIDTTFRMNVVGNAVPEMKKVQNQMKSLDNQVKRSGVAMNQFGGALTGAGKDLRKWSMGTLQQAGYQVGDFAVQVANGTSKAQAFGQQASQFAGVFGPIGAVVGAGIAIVSAFVVAQEKLADGAKNAKKKLEELTDSFDQAHKSVSDFGNVLRTSSLSAIKDVRQAYGELNGDLIGFLNTLEELRRDTAIVDAAAAAKKFFEGSPIAELEKEYASFNEERKKFMAASREGAIAAEIALLEQQIRVEQQNIALAQRMGNTFVESLSLEYLAQYQNELDALKATAQEGFAAIQKLSIPEAAIQNMLIYRNAIQSAFEAGNAEGLRVNLTKMRDLIETLPDPIRGKLLPDFLKLEDLGRRLGVELDSAAGAAQTLSRFIASSAIQAGRLAANLAKAPAGIQAMKDETARINAQIAAIKNGYDEISSSSAAYRVQQEQELGLSEAGSAAEQAYISAIINKRVAAYEEGERAKKQLSDLQNEFYNTGKAGGSALDELRKKTRQAADAAKAYNEKFQSLRDTIETGFTNSFMAVIDGTKSVSDAFKNMAKSIISELYNVLVVQQMVGSWGGGGILGAIGGLFPSIAPVPVPTMPSYDGGGYTGMGARAGGLDGKGGKLAMVHPNETVVDHSRGQGVGGVTVVQNINISTGVQQTVRNEIRTMMPQIAESAKAAVVDAKRRGGGYGRAFA